MNKRKTFAVADVKAAPDDDSPNGSFEVILSAQTLDRDGEVIDAKAFEPLPESIPFHAFHDFSDPIGRGVPFYDGDVLKARGTYASTPRAQEIRTLVTEGVIGHTSVGFMAASRKDGDDDAPHITSAELLEGSFVSVPSNREAAVLLSKAYEAEAKQGARNSTKDSERLQSIHDLAVENGAACEPGKALAPAGPSIVRKAHGMTANDLRDALERVVREGAAAESWTWVRDYADDWVVFEVMTDDVEIWRQSYTVTDGAVALSGTAEQVVARTTYEPATPAPVNAPAARAVGASPARAVVEKARLDARAALLSLAD